MGVGVSGREEEGRAPARTAYLGLHAQGHPRRELPGHGGVGAHAQLVHLHTRQHASQPCEVHAPEPVEPASHYGTRACDVTPIELVVAANPDPNRRVHRPG
jgi:hypothetical protein